MEVITKEPIRIMSLDSLALYKAMIDTGNYNNRSYIDKDGVERQKEWTKQYNSTMNDSLWLMHLNTLEKDGVVKVHNNGTGRNADGTTYEKTAKYTDAVVQIRFEREYKQDKIFKDEKKRVQTKLCKEDKRKNAKRKSNRMELVDVYQKEVIKNVEELRAHIYKYGVIINGCKYVMDIRSSSMAGVGDCLFIKEKYHKKMEELRIRCR